MKKLFLLYLICLWHAPIFAQTKQNPDSLAYQLQRTKINGMLDARRIKFGQYDESLRKHTGIFGLQTKKDIRRSNEILMDINRTDDSIFMQIKILLSYRTFQQQQAQTKSAEVENYSLGYMNTINRLREQIDKIKRDALANKQADESHQRIYVILLVLMVASILILLFTKSRAKA